MIILATLFTLKSLVFTVQQVSKNVGVDANYMCKIAKLESNWNPSAVNSSTNAKGLFQITKPTEISLRKRYGITGKIFTANTNAKLATLLTKEHVKYLTKKKLPVTYENLYILHFFGIPAGYKFLTTSNETIVKERFPKEYKHNKWLIGNKTIGQLKQHFKDKLSKAKNCNELI